MTDSKRLDPVVVLAVAKYFEALAKEARPLVKKGDHPVEASIAIAGTLKVGLDYTAMPSSQLSGLKLLAAFRRLFREEKITQQKANAMLNAAIVLALENPAELDAEEVKDLEESIEASRKRLHSKLTPEPRFGQVKFNGLAAPVKAKSSLQRTKVG